MGLEPVLARKIADMKSKYQSLKKISHEQAKKYKDDPGGVPPLPSIIVLNVESPSKQESQKSTEGGYEGGSKTTNVAIEE